MRTTVTLDDDVQRLLRDAMHRSRTNFKETLNAAIRTGLVRKNTTAKREPFVLKPRRMGLRPGIDPSSLNKLADDLEIDSVRAPQRKGRAR